MVLRHTSVRSVCDFPGEPSCLSKDIEWTIEKELDDDTFVQSGSCPDCDSLWRLKITDEQVKSAFYESGGITYCSCHEKAFVCFTYSGAKNLFPKPELCCLSCKTTITYRR